jgi:hypothetical protein
MDQRANSIADMAAVLWGRIGSRHGSTGRGVRGQKKSELVPKFTDPPPAPKEVEEVEVAEVDPEVAVLETDIDAGQDGKVVIQWANILDAEFAESWPETVVHDGLRWDAKTSKRYVAPKPRGPPPVLVVEQVEEGAEGEEGVVAEGTIGESPVDKVIVDKGTIAEKSSVGVGKGERKVEL